jgi:hypothetical protein
MKKKLDSQSSVAVGSLKKVNHYESTVNEILQSDTLEGLEGKIDTQINFLNSQLVDLLKT